MVTIAKTFNDDMNDYIIKVSGKRERFVGASKKKPVVEKVPDEVSEEEVFVEYEDARPGAGFAGWLSSLFQRKVPEEQVPEDLPETEAKVLEDMEDEVEEVDHEIEELEEKRESLWSRFLKSMRSSRRAAEGESSEDALAASPPIDEDVKHVLKLLHGWLEKLPHTDMQAFKASDDFQRYKAVLEKYGLIKKE
ncbi:hypothetical protein GF367_02450 [Candidatus Woesearchaeota archaeon]|nr:hypothetical protein [Candidatus Woesearchaeota archaeon]